VLKYTALVSVALLLLRLYVMSFLIVLRCV